MQACLTTTHHAGNLPCCLCCRMYVGVCRELTGLLQDMLQVEDVWFLSHGHKASQEFVLWAGQVLEHR